MCWLRISSFASMCKRPQAPLPQSSPADAGVRSPQGPPGGSQPASRKLGGQKGTAERRGKGIQGMSYRKGSGLVFNHRTEACDPL